MRADLKYEVTGWRITPASVARLKRVTALIRSRPDLFEFERTPEISDVLSRAVAKFLTEAEDILQANQVPQALHQANRERFE